MALKRELGPISVFAIGAGAMVSSGLFVLPAIAFAVVGPGVYLCFLLAAVLLLPTILSKAELMTAMPKAGGTYYYIDRSLGPGFGTVGGLAAWASLAFKSAFALLGIGALAKFTWPALTFWQVKAIACGFCVLFALLNVVGVKHAGRVQVGLVALLLAILWAFAIAGLGSVDSTHYEPLLPGGANSLLVGAAMVFVSFGGVTKVATLGEEVGDPKRDLLIGMFGSCAVVGVLYVLVVYVTVGLLPADSAQWSLAPLSQAAGAIWGGGGVLLLGVAGLAAFLTTGNAGILAASRIVMAMSQDDLVPRRLGSVSDRWGTPVRAILCTSGFMIAVILLLDLELFAKAASAMKILLFTFTLLSLVLMRESRLPTYNPSWRCPFYPWVQIVGIVCYGFLLVELGTVPLAITGVILGGGVAWYMFYAKVNVMRESALIRVAGRFAKADFQDHDLEAELSRVARDHSKPLEDRFDRLIQACTVLDMTEGATREELFRVVAENLSTRIDRPAAELADLLQRREVLSSTVVRPGLAIPHLILDDADSFHILLVRCRPGVVFQEGEPPVHVVFAIVAPPADRNFYLKALMAIAEIAQDEAFDRRWLESGRAEALREVVLSAERRRDAANGA